MEAHKGQLRRRLVPDTELAAPQLLEDGVMESYFGAETEMLGARYRRLTRDYFLAVQQA